MAVRKMLSRAVLFALLFNARWVQSDPPPSRSDTVRFVAKPLQAGERKTRWMGMGMKLKLKLSIPEEDKSVTTDSFTSFRYKTQLDRLKSDNVNRDPHWQLSYDEYELSATVTGSPEAEDDRTLKDRKWRVFIQNDELVIKYATGNRPNAEVLETVTDGLSWVKGGSVEFSPLVKHIQDRAFTPGLRLDLKNDQVLVEALTEMFNLSVEKVESLDVVFKEQVIHEKKNCGIFEYTIKMKSKSNSSGHLVEVMSSSSGRWIVDAATCDVLVWEGEVSASGENNLVYNNQEVKLKLGFHIKHRYTESRSTTPKP